MRKINVSSCFLIRRADVKMSAEEMVVSSVRYTILIFSLKTFHLVFINYSSTKWARNLVGGTCKVGSPAEFSIL